MPRKFIASFDLFRHGLRVIGKRVRCLQCLGVNVNLDGFGLELTECPRDLEMILFGYLL